MSDLILPMSLYALEFGTKIHAVALVDFPDEVIVFLVKSSRVPWQTRGNYCSINYNAASPGRIVILFPDCQHLS